MNRLLTLAVLALCSTALIAGDLAVGSKVSDFKLEDLSGNKASFSSLKGDVTVLMFVATKCPVSNAYNERMQKVFEEYAAKGVKFIGINSNHTEPAPEVAAHRQENHFGFAVYKDPSNVVADMFDAQVTPEVFVLDKVGVIRYHGYIDDSQNPANIKKQGLRLALDEVLSGKAVTTADTKAFGCTIKREKKVS